MWVFGLARATLTRLTREAGEDESPVWTPDGNRVTYTSTRGQSRFTFWKAADGTGPEMQLFAVPRHQHLSGWTPDGRTLLTEEVTGVESDLFFGRPGESVTAPYLETPFDKRGSRLSPDGRWIAYASDETGHNEVYVERFRDNAGRVQVSINGGTEPVWAHSGREVFYRNENKLLAVRIDPGPPLRAGTPSVLFDKPYSRVVWGEADYDVMADDSRFLMIEGDAQAPVTQLNVIVNWGGDVGRNAPK